MYKKYYIIFVDIVHDLCLHTQITGAVWFIICCYQM